MFYITHVNILSIIKLAAWCYIAHTMQRALSVCRWTKDAFE